MCVSLKSFHNATRKLFGHSFVEKMKVNIYKYIFNIFMSLVKVSKDPGSFCTLPQN